MTKTIVMKSGLFLITLLAVCSCKNNGNESNADKNMMHKIASLSPDDKNLKRFKDTAQKQMDYLILFMSEHNREDTLFEYFVKSNFQEDGENEHMWSRVSEFNNNYFIGTLANDPGTLKKMKAGDSVQILRDDVEDWILNDYLTNTKVGGFSVEYLRARGK